MIQESTTAIAEDRRFDELIGRIRKAGLRVTEPRMGIIRVLLESKEPIAIEHLHKRVGHKNCDLVTVYRIVEAFEKIGLVRRSFLHNGTATLQLIAGAPLPFYVTCKETNSRREIDPELAEKLRAELNAIEELLRSRGCKEVTSIVEFFGRTVETAEIRRFG